MPHNEKILIVDDERRVCDSLKDLLSAQGYEAIEIRYNGHDALEYLAGNTADLVLLDITMGQMNGFQVMERLAHLHLDIPVIIMTGSDSTASVVEALRKGAYDYLRKPFDPAELFTSVKNALNQRRLKQENGLVKRKLRDSEEHFKTFFNQASDCIFVVNPSHMDDPVIVDVNEAACKTHGYTANELIGKPFSSLYAEEAKKSGSERIRRLQSGEQLVFESEHIRKDGSIFPVEISARRIDVGDTPFLYFIERDDTKRKQAEQEYRSLIETSQDLIWKCDVNGRTTFLNPAWEDTFGYRLEEMIGRPFSEFQSPEIAKRALPQFAQVLAGGTVKGFETTHLSKSGKEIHLIFKAKSVLNKQGKIAGTIGTAFDITEHKLVQKELEASENKYRKLVETISDVIFEINDQGNITYVSPVGLEIWGGDPCEIIGRNFSELVHPEDRDRLINRFSGLKLGIEAPESYRFVNRAGRVIWVRSRTTPVIEEGIFKGARGVLSDFTMQKQAEEERLLLEKRLQQAQKAESLGRMAGAIAHHFNNQLAVVMGNLELVMEERPQEDIPAEKLTHEAMQAAQRAAEVSRLMLTYLGQTTARKTPMNICEVCNRSLPLLLAVLPKRILLATNFSSSGPTINGDPNQIQQLLTNLVTNAQEAVGEGLGAIELNVKTVLATEIPSAFCFPVGWQPRDKIYACLEVADAGHGIAEKDIEKIFDPFFSSRFAGRGLGLAVVLGILRSHDGAITVESKPGLGSIFRIFLPVVREAIDCPPEKSATTSPLGNGGTILLVEDEAQVRRMAAIMLKRLGFRVLEARDGVDAVAVFRQRRDEIRCVLCDLTMPRMCGWETLAALRRLSPGIPVILASGYDEGQVMAGNHSDRPDAFLNKPYSIKDLAAKIRHVIA